ncbi:MAG: endonuclease/exonuclease/phosphatase family protein [Bacteroidetes bacterium]|nr:endonuclease/exonuclease/phosphatase family protein [Bacteroidota bacterium]
MQKYFVALISLILFSLSASAQDKQYRVGVLGFYNCENFYDTIDDPKVDDAEYLPNSQNHYDGAVYQDKVARLTEVLSQVGRDITPDGLSLFGVSEIENETVLNDLVAQPAFKGRNYKLVHYDSPDARGVDVALIYNPKYFQVLYSAPLHVDLIEEGKPHATRDVLWVNGIYAGDTINVFVNHWPSRRGGEEASAPYRAIAAGVAKHVIDSLMAINPETKVVLMGDLNDDPTSPSVAKVLGAKGDKEKVKAGGLYNPWVRFIKDGVGTLAYDDMWNLFDQIIISHGWLDQSQHGWFYNKALIFRKDFMIQQTGKYKGYPLRTYDGNTYQHGYSDHLPTYIVVVKEVVKK